MRRGFANLIEGKGRSFSQFLMKHYAKLKPLLQWVDPKIRSRFKAIILRSVFKMIYSVESDISYDAGLKKGVNLIGYPHADIGEGEFVRQTARSFSRIDVEFGIYNYTLENQLSQNDQRLASFTRPDNPYAINIFHLKPDQVEASIIRLGESFVAGRLNIGYWVWELSEFPDAWMGPLKYFHEIWCPSRFVQSAVSDCSTRPVLYMPPGFEIEEPKGFDRAYFKLPEDRFLYLFVFDFKSYISRKNPLGCIQAFQNAFPRGNKTVGLVIKSMDGHQYPAEFKGLNEATRSDPRITCIDATFTSEEVTGLMSVCDTFVSLHRSEGIGLSIAQSMLLGKPVITTNYSGNTDFTRPDNSCLVDYKLTPVKEGEYQFWEGQVWADPDLDHAVEHMRRLAEDKTYRDTVAQAGRSYIKTFHNPEVAGKTYRSRLVELGLLKS